MGRRNMASPPAQLDCSHHHHRRRLQRLPAPLLPHTSFPYSPAHNVNILCHILTIGTAMLRERVERNKRASTWQQASVVFLPPPPLPPPPPPPPPSTGWGSDALRLFHSSRACPHSHVTETGSRIQHSHENGRKHAENSQSKKIPASDW